jgi:hypothetical protein
MMREQNQSKNDAQTVSFDTIYSDENQRQINSDEKNLIHQDIKCTCCCFWWFSWNL